MHYIMDLKSLKSIYHHPWRYATDPLKISLSRFPWSNAAIYTHLFLSLFQQSELGGLGLRLTPRFQFQAGGFWFQTILENSWNVCFCIELFCANIAKQQLPSHGQDQSIKSRNRESSSYLKSIPFFFGVAVSHSCPERYYNPRFSMHKE
jgi:hypothetical protein